MPIWSAPTAGTSYTAGNGLTLATTVFSINTNNALGIGASCYCVPQSGSIAANATGSVNSVNFSLDLITAPTQTALAGTWRNVSGASITAAGGGVAGECIRTA